jgi:multiple sugar transport system substrate-binding protein
VWVFGGQSASQYGRETEKILSTYENDTGNSVELTSTPYPQFLDKIQTALRGGEGPDIIQSDVVWTPLLASQGWLEPLDDRYSSAAFSESDFFEASIETCQWEGNLVGVPFMDGEWGLWYYNADLVEQAGYDPMDPPFETWDDMMQVGTDIKEQTGNAPVGLMGSDTETLSAQWSGFYFTTGAQSWLTEDKTSAIIDQEPGVRTATLYKDLLDQELIPPGTPNNNQFDVRNLFTSEQIAMYQVGSWEKAILEEKSDVRFGITGLPTSPGGSVGSMYGGWNWVVNTESNNKDAAWDLITRFTTKDAQLRTASLPPALKAASEEQFSEWNDPLGRNVGPTLIEQIENASPRPVHPKYPSMSEVLRGQMQSVLLGETSPSDAMSAAASNINDML